MPMRYLSLILVLGLAAACDAKNEPANRPPSTQPSPGPVPPDSFLINPPNDRPR
jgi:hypothetical protein